MADRLKSLRRIEAVQKQMVRLSSWRLATAERTCRDLAADKLRLQGYLIDEGALGPGLAKAALRSLHALDTRLSEAERARDASKATLDQATRREHAVGDITERARRASERMLEDRELAMTVEAWLAAKGPAEEAERDASLP